MARGYSIRVKSIDVVSGCKSKSEHGAAPSRSTPARVPLRNELDAVKLEQQPVRQPYGNVILARVRVDL